MSEDLSFVIGGVVVGKDDFVAAVDAKCAASGKDRPEMIWLTMIPCANACMFCTNPTGDTYLTYANPHEYYNDRTGYLTCSKCDEKAQAILEEIRVATLAKISHLVGLPTVKVKRSNGVIEDWKFKMYQNRPTVVITQKFLARVRVESGEIHKDLMPEDLLALN